MGFSIRTCISSFIWFDFSFICFFFSLSVELNIYIFHAFTLRPPFPWSLLPSLSLSPLFLSSSLHLPLFGISSSISFKAHVKGTVYCFQRPLCPAFLPLNLVSPKHFPIAGLSRLFSPSSLPFSSQLSLLLKSFETEFHWRRVLQNLMQFVNMHV